MERTPNTGPGTAMSSSAPEFTYTPEAVVSFEFYLPTYEGFGLYSMFNKVEKQLAVYVVITTDLPSEDMGVHITFKQHVAPRCLYKSLIIMNVNLVQ